MSKSGCLFFLVIASACGAVSASDAGSVAPDGSGAMSDSGRADAGGTDAGASDAGLSDAGSIDGGVTVWQIPVRVVRDNLGPTRLYCLARRGDAGVALLVDTGSQLTFLGTPAGSPDYLADAGTVLLGDRMLVLPGRPFTSSESIDHLPVVGILGNDFFFEQATELDLDGQWLRRSNAPWDSTGWTALPYENRFDYMFVTVQLNQQTVRLAFDTGAPHSLLLDAGAQPGDQPISTQDAYGNPLTLYLGTATLSFAGSAIKVVPLVRAPSFPSLEDSNRALGGPYVHGLFGLTSIGGGVIRIDANRSTIWFR